MFWPRQIFINALLILVVTEWFKAASEVTFIRAEIKRNNVTISASDETRRSSISESRSAKINMMTALNSTRHLLSSDTATTATTQEQPNATLKQIKAISGPASTRLGSMLPSNALAMQTTVESDATKSDAIPAASTAAIATVPSANTTWAAPNEAPPASDKGARRSEVYVVNNGLLLLHPKKIVTLSGVKKSTQPLPPAINYHVFKKLNRNSSNNDIALKILDNHVRRRSVLKDGSEINKEMQRANIGQSARFSTASKVALSNTSNSIENHADGKAKSLKRKRTSKRNKFHNSLSRLNKVMPLYSREEQSNVKKALIENPLFDIDQSENLQQEHARRNVHNSKKRSGSRQTGTEGIERIPDIRAELEKLEHVPQYPRFKIHSFEGSLFPRFPLKKLRYREYPRFPIRPLAEENVFRYPIRPAALVEYPRYPVSRPASLEYPRSEEQATGYSQFPLSEHIKPLNLETVPRFEKIKALNLETVPRFGGIKPLSLETVPRFGGIKPLNLEAVPRFGGIKPLNLETVPLFEKTKPLNFETVPRFEGIKPLNLETVPRFEMYPEATAIPEIKDIDENTNKRSRQKRSRHSKRHGDDDDDDDDNDDENNDDDNDDDDDAEYEYHKHHTHARYYPEIESIDAIPGINKPQEIPSIADIPALPDIPFIPSLHPIHGIHPIQDLKPIPPAAAGAGDARSVKAPLSRTTVENRKPDVKSQ